MEAEIRLSVSSLLSIIQLQSPGLVETKLFRIIFRQSLQFHRHFTIMASKTLVFLAFFASTVSMILSIPQLQLAVQPQQEPQVQQPEPEVPANPNAPADNVPLPLIPLPRTFGSLFNLSAYLANAPANESALNFIPLITLLTAKG